jgi:hypothetical protein
MMIHQSWEILWKLRYIMGVNFSVENLVRILSVASFAQQEHNEIFHVILCHDIRS